MRPAPLLLLLAAAGCYRGADAPIERPAPAPASAGPPPRLAWIDNGFDTARVPAVSADGAAILIGLADPDGGRGNPNSRLELRDRRDAKLGGRVVLAAAEVALVTISYGGTDTCWEPSDAPHVVAW